MTTLQVQNNNYQTFNASDLKSNMSTVFSSAVRSPIQISRYGKENFIMMTEDLYNKFEIMEDYLWGLKAQQAMRSGLVGTDTAEKTLFKMLQDA